MQNGYLATSLLLVTAALASGQDSGLEARLKTEGAESLAKEARESGDAVRGAILFHQPHMACTKCHAVDGSESRLGPDLTQFAENPADAHFVEAMLEPSKSIRKGFETVTIGTADGKIINGLLAGETPERVTLRDLAQDGKQVVIPRDEIDAQKTGDVSAMPAGQVNQLASRQQFLDLVCYLLELRDGGLDRARQLQPSPAQFALRLPEYESHVDHTGLLRDLGSDSYKRGEAIYQRLCINCHGTHDQPGSLPTSLRFAEGKFKSGSDPYTMYQTLTRGFGLMVPQAWMVPQQKYDVIHYIREAYLKRHNPSQYFAITGEYLEGLPKGDTRGPEPRVIEPWVTMDYGPSLINTYEIGSDGSNFAYKGIAVRLDAGAGGISRGRAWMIFDHDTMRMAAAWTGAGFIDWNGIHFNGRHQIHPRIVGDLQLANSTGPGWADPATGSFADEQRVVGRDGRCYGPLPKSWATYHGLYQHGDQIVISYSIGGTKILEMPGAVLPWPKLPASASINEQAGSLPHGGVADAVGIGRQAGSLHYGVFTRTLNIGPRAKEMTLLVATHPGESPKLTLHDGVAAFGTGDELAAPKEKSLVFDGTSYLEAADAAAFDMTASDFTVTARIRTRQGGTIFARSPPEGKWAPDGKAFFVRGGKLCYDIGWVGVVQSRQSVSDGQWHDVALRWHEKDALAELFVDGKPAGKRELRPKQPAPDQVVRVGYTSPNFPGPQSYFSGDLGDVRFFQRALSDDELTSVKDIEHELVAHWELDGFTDDGRIADSSGGQRAAKWQSGAGPTDATTVVAWLSGKPAPGTDWFADENRLCLRIPAGAQPVQFTIWMTRCDDSQQVTGVVENLPVDNEPPDLVTLTRGGPAHWPQKLVTEAAIDPTNGAFAADVLTHPENNPWLAQVRPTGLDFYSDPDRAAVCAWDGDVWLVSGLSKLDMPAEDGKPPPLTWQRIACGLFQPLGVKIIDDVVYVTCRDQLVILRDTNGDGETDFYECFNNDHQVTDHFHEFAMGLQVDEAGNFYYAKSARHALPAVVPHHGTLLRISPDGSRTDILATGFRAANGVCLNPDGTFVVTDQEGHWNPKNRINWVTPGGFYGNMFGYHDVADASDEAMQQPLCWITNEFDRSPAELVWVPKDCWGPLAGSLLNLSYGYGKLYVVPHEEAGGNKQGGLCMLPVGPLPTGVMRGRFHPVDRQLYTCGMFAWAGSATQAGGVYRIRATGQPMQLPIGLEAHKDGMQITFTEPLDRETATDVANYRIKTWSLKRTANYGSKHYDEQPLAISAAELSKDGCTLLLKTPDIQPTWCMEIVCRLKDTDGRTVERVIHNSVFALGD
jgi:putative heme-binding domain-containing protein